MFTVLSFLVFEITDDLNLFYAFSKFYSILYKNIECLNKKFDHNVCEALDQVETDEVEEGTVLAVYQNGYKLNGKLMRPARVKVAKAKEEVKE